MVEKTSNHGLNKYQIGDTDWTHTADMETIEKRLVIRDLNVDRTKYTPYEGAIFISTDTGTVYDGDGSEWQRASRRMQEGSVDTVDDGDSSAIPNIAWIQKNVGTTGDILTTFNPDRLNQYDGSTGSYSVVDGDIAGDYMLQYANDSGSVDLLWTDTVQTRRGDSYATYLRLSDTDSNAPGLIVCGQLDDSNDLVGGYAAVLFVGSGKFRIIKEPTSSSESWASSLTEQSVSPIANELYRIEMDVGLGGMLRARLFDSSDTEIAAISTVDSEFDSGVWGYRNASSATGNTVDFDQGMRRSLISVHGSSSNSSDGNTGSGSGGHTWINVVEDYSAVGDGNTDDTQAFLDAIDAAGTGGTVFIPQGTYYTTGEVKFTANHNGVTVVGEGYNSHIKGDGNLNWLWRVDGSGIRNITIKNLRFSGSDYANLTTHTGMSDARGILFQNIWSHNTGRGILIGSNGAVLDGARVWNCDHNGVSFHGPESSASKHTWRFGNNIIAWNNKNSDDTVYGIDLSKQSAAISNVLCINNSRGMKTSNYGQDNQISNAYLVNNDTYGYQGISDGDGTVQITNMVADSNGKNGIVFSDSSGTQIGQIVACNNGEYGINIRSDSEVSISSAFTRGNLSGGVNSVTNGWADIMHLVAEDGVNNDDNLWVLRSRDYNGSVH